MGINAKTGLNALGDRELGALIRASPLYPILIEFEKEEIAAKTYQESAAKSSQDVIHSQTI